MGHKESEIDFTKLAKASIIIGMEDGSFKTNNAVGKTTLFNAIYFALFDATVGKKSRVIRRGENKCEVELTFAMASGEYKIQRSRTKSTKTVQIFKQNDKVWENLSGRTNSDTEKTICKILGISQKMFEKSSYFKQDDKFDLASATAEKRKAIIIDMLHLKEWSLYEKQAKIVKADLEKDIEVLEKTISIMGDPSKNISKYKKSLSDLLPQIKEKEAELKLLNNDIVLKTKEYNELKRKNSTGTKDIESKLKSENLYLKEINKDILKIENEIKEKTFRVNKIMESYKVEQENCLKYRVSYEHITSNYPEEVPDSLYNNLNDEIIHCNNTITSLESSFKILAKDVPDDDFCPTCFTELNEKNRNEIMKIKQDKLNKISVDTKEVKEKRKLLLEKKNKYDIKIGELRKYVAHKDTCVDKISNCETSMKYMDEQLSYIKESIEDNSKDLKSKNEAKKKTANTIYELEQKIESTNNISFDEEIDVLKVDINNLNKKVNKEKDILMGFVYNKGGCEKEIQTNKKESEKLKKLKVELNEKKKLCSVYKTATYTFSSRGIPAMIISTVLDSLQSEVNAVLNILRPSIQIQFFLEKERSDGKQEDTLGMKFFVNSIEWDYEELSGGQQACISLALKFAISVINRKRCGADIRVLLLDEVDQGLDFAGRESFYKVVQKWSDDIVILVITHSEQIIDMFDSKVLVSKENGITTAKVMT